jgi:hypothetical protein
MPGFVWRNEIRLSLCWYITDKLDFTSQTFLNLKGHILRTGRLFQIFICSFFVIVGFAV